MKAKKIIKSAALVFLGGLTAFSAIRFAARPEAKGSAAGAPAAITEPLPPIRIELIPLNEPTVGGVTRFGVDVESGIDPDLVKNIRLEYDLPERVRRPAALGQSREVLRKSGRSRLELDVIIPDEARYAVRARLSVELANGKTVSRSAVRWVDIGKEEPDEGEIGRIAGPDGSGIRVYRGKSLKEPR